MESSKEIIAKSSENTTQDQDGEKREFLQCRYLVVLVGFITYVLTNCHTLSTSISIVVMVKNSHRQPNTSYLSCPMNIENTTGDSGFVSEGEFDWSPKTQGYILGSSAVGLFIAQLPGGLLAENIGGKLTIISGIFVSSLCHLLTPFVAWESIYLLIAAQFLRGIGQGLIPPSNFVLAANWTPRNERGIVMSFIMTGICVGSIVGGVAAGAMSSSSVLGGWPSVFYIFGALGIIISIIYMLFIFETPKHHPRITSAELNYILENQETDLSKKRPPTPWRKILSSVPFWALTVAVFGQFWSSSHFLSIHPTFLGTILHYSIKENGLFASVPFALQAVLTVGAGWISNWLLKNNYLGLSKVRKGCNFISCLGYSICVLGIYSVGCNKTWSSVFSFLAIGFTGFAYAGCMINPVDLSPTFIGTILGIGSLISASSNYIVPILVGYLTNHEQTLEQWGKFFFISIAVVMSSGVFFCLFGSAEIQPWNYLTTGDLEITDPQANKEINAYENAVFQPDSLTHI